MNLNTYCAQVWHQLDRVTLDCWRNLHLATVNFGYNGDDFNLSDQWYVQPQVFAKGDYNWHEYNYSKMPRNAPAMIDAYWLNPVYPGAVYSFDWLGITFHPGLLYWEYGPDDNGRKTKPRRSYYTGIVARRRNLPADH